MKNLLKNIKIISIIFLLLFSFTSMTAQTPQEQIQELVSALEDTNSLLVAEQEKTVNLENIIIEKDNLLKEKENAVSEIVDALDRTNEQLVAANSIIKEQEKTIEEKNEELNNKKAEYTKISNLYDSALITIDDKNQIISEKNNAIQELVAGLEESNELLKQIKEDFVLPSINLSQETINELKDNSDLITYLDSQVSFFNLGIYYQFYNGKSGVGVLFNVESPIKFIPLSINVGAYIYQDISFAYQLGIGIKL